MPKLEPWLKVGRRTIKHDGNDLELDMGINALAFSADGTFLVSGGEDHTVRVWSTSDGAELACISEEGTYRPHAVKHLALGLDDTRAVVAYGSSGSAAIWDLKTGTLVKKLVELVDMGGHPLEVDFAYLRAVAFGPAGIFLSRGPELTWHFSPDGELRRAATAEETDRGWAKRVALSRDGSQMAWVADDADTTILTSIFPSALSTATDVEVLAFSPKGRLLAAGDVSALTVWDTSSADPVHSFPGAGSWDERPTSLALSPSEALIASGHARGEVRVWNLNGERLFEGALETKTNIISLAFAPDESALAAGTLDGHILRVTLAG